MEIHTRLVPLSRSPSCSSHSSLTSEENIFDHTAPPSDTELGPRKEPTLGLRELASMAIHDNKPVYIPPEIPPGIQLLKALGQEPDSWPFARDVEIKGWKTVGGKSWTDGAKVGAYVVYDIQVTLRKGGTMSVLRRYTDFVNLRSALKTRYPHLRQAIPKLPGKAHMAKFSPSFLADRQPRLQRFLRTIMLHPEMGRAGHTSVIGKWITGNGESVLSQ